MDNWISRGRGVPCVNDSGEAIPPFACMAIDSTELENGEVILHVIKPLQADIDKGPAVLVFNGEIGIPIDGTGFASLDAVVHAIEGDTIAEGEECGPVDDEWHLASSGNGYWKIASDTESESGADDVMVVRTSGGSTLRLYLFTLTGTIASGAGVATIRNMTDSTEIETGASVKDILGHFDGLVSGYRGICVKQAGEYYAIGPYVIDVRWDAPDLEQSKKPATYTNIDTAEDCS